MQKTTGQMTFISCLDVYGGIIPELSGGDKSKCFGGESWHSESYRIKHSGGDRVDLTFWQWLS